MYSSSVVCHTHEKKLFEEVKNERRSIEKESENEKRSRMRERREIGRERERERAAGKHIYTHIHTGTVSILFCFLLARCHYNYILDVVIFSLIIITRVCWCARIVTQSSSSFCYCERIIKTKNSLEEAHEQNSPIVRANGSAMMIHSL